MIAHAVVSCGFGLRVSTWSTGFESLPLPTCPIPNKSCQRWAGMITLTTYEAIDGPSWNRLLAIILFYSLAC